MAKAQASKRSRKHRKQAAFLGLHRNTAHPSHIRGSQWIRRCQQRAKNAKDG